MKLLQRDARRAAAYHSFWSNHPLNLAFRADRGTETFTLKDFIAYVIELPADRFHALTGGRDAA